MSWAKPAPVFLQGLAGVIFDCDGVMIDSRAANNYFYNRVLECLDLPPMTQAQEAYVCMATVEQSLRHIVPEQRLNEVDDIFRHKVSYEREIMPLLRLMPGFTALVEDLHASGLRMAVATNRSSEGMQRVLDFFALPPYFNPVITASNAAPKPSPEGALQICTAWGVPPTQALFVGDSLSDAQSALAADMPFAAFDNEALQGSFHVRDHAALRHALAPCLRAGKSLEKP